MYVIVLRTDRQELRVTKHCVVQTAWQITDFLLANSFYEYSLLIDHRTRKLTDIDAILERWADNFNSELNRLS